MLDLRKDLELAEVVYSGDKKKATMAFLDRDLGEVLEVNFNKQEYKDGNWIDNEEKAEQVNEWCKKYFDLKFEDLTKAIGRKMDVYKYEKFNSLWEVNYVEKFKVEDEGKIIQTKISEVVDDGRAIRIRFEYNGSTYESKMGYAKYYEATKEWFTDPQKKDAQYKKFKEKFGVPVEKADSIVGKDIMCEVKVAFKKFAYVEIKKPVDWK